ncbi:ssk1 response regulator receiver [Dissophora globulifera]|nr:ssk1 response regulator receiver [Dissophora globulifera]
MPADTVDSSLESSDELSAVPTSPAPSLSYWILGYGLVGFLGLTLALSVQSWHFHLWNPFLVLTSLSPLMMGPILVSLDKISDALSQDEARHTNELEELHERHENLLEACKEDNLFKKNILLETVGKEVLDAATLAIETLRQMTPTSLFPPSLSREQLSPCTLPIPITSILGLFTTMRHLQYISRNMQRLSRVMFTEYVQGIVEKTSPHYHRGENKFDVGEFVQSLGDLVSADASLKGVEFVIYHSEYGLNHVLIKGSEESWRHALINLIKSIIDCAKTGSTVELCLALFAMPQSDGEKNKVVVSFEITYYPNSTSTEDDLAKLNALLASKLVKAMGGSLEIEQLEKFAKRFVVSVEVELSQTPQEERPGVSKVSEDHQRAVHPLEPIGKSEDGNRPVAAQDHLQRLENMQTIHPVHESQQFFQQHIKTPGGSSSPPPASPSPRRSGAGSSFTEPTVSELVRFSRKLPGLRAVLISKEHSAFAVHLMGYLKAWGFIVTKKSAREANEAAGEADRVDNIVGDEPQTPSGTTKRSISSSSPLSGKANGPAGKSESPSSSLTAKASAPAFIMIDDDVSALRQQILKMQSTPMSPAPAAGASKRSTHRRHKSITSIQHTSIIYFTSLPTFKEARDAVMSILGPQMPGMHYSIANTFSSSGLGHGPLGPLPYILVLPKPAGPRRVLTAIHTAINVPILDQPYSPIATAPTSPAPTIRHFSEEVNPLDRDQIVYDPVSNQAFARTVLYSQSPPGDLSPNHGLLPEQRQRNDIIRQLIDAGGNIGSIAYPFDHSSAIMASPDTPGSLQSIGSPTGIIVPGTANQPAGIQFDPTARSSGTLSPSLTGPALRRASNGGGRLSVPLTSNGETGTVVIPPSLNTGSHQSFAPMHQRTLEGSSTPAMAGIKRLSARLAKDSKASPSLVKSGGVERVSPLVNVLIVEDNDINQKILVKFMRKCKIRYDLACNGREAVDKWKVGGFHLVLMDIQMPVMDGIEATREIRRLEKAQKIGVFPTNKPNSVGNSMLNALSSSAASSSSSSGSAATTPPASPFRSPVIIVALTASAESEDLRRTALLAGCNDYIIKPVQLPWLERKIVDWGCMQALIDVDAWKEWKQNQEGASPGSPSGGAGSSNAALRKSLANAGSVTRANLKRPSISSRSIKGSKAAAAAAKSVEKAEDSDASDKKAQGPVVDMVASANSRPSTLSETGAAAGPSPSDTTSPALTKSQQVLLMFPVNRQQSSSETDTSLGTVNSLASQILTIADEDTTSSLKSAPATPSAAPTDPAESK